MLQRDFQEGSAFVGQAFQPARISALDEIGGL